MTPAEIQAMRERCEACASWEPGLEPLCCRSLPAALTEIERLLKRNIKLAEAVTERCDDCQTILERRCTETCPLFDCHLWEAARSDAEPMCSQCIHTENDCAACVDA